jgi:hypothetical protein
MQFNRYGVQNLNDYIGAIAASDLISDQ